MKTFLVLVLCLLLVGCQQNASNEAFKKNSETIRAYLKSWESEKIDYSIFAADFVQRNTSMGKDTIRLEEMKANDKALMDAYDFKLIGGDSVVLLPGVNTNTKMPDGSVRYYGDWQLTKPATDSTEARTGIVKLYASYDFNPEGKIVFAHEYGNFTELMNYLNAAPKIKR